MMPRSLFPFKLLVVALAAFATTSTTLADEPENYRQLQAMPRERRIALSENLERFDKLDSNEQAAIRKLDAEIARTNPVEQARYRSLLRRYHLWANGLTDDQKAQLQAAQTPEARFSLARKFRLKEQENASTGPRIFGIRTGDYGLVGPYEAAYLLKIWNRLTPATKFEIEKQQVRGKLFAAIRDANRSLHISPPVLPNDEEKRLDAAIEGNDALNHQLDLPVKRAEAPSKKADAAHPASKTEAQKKRSALRLAEFLYFEEHKPKQVSQKNLERFSNACPNWLHSIVDPLSPDDARAYLTILYRLLYPEPDEIPADTKPAKSPATPVPSSAKPGPKKSGPQGPY